MTTTEFSVQLVDLEESLYKYANQLRLDKADAKDLIQETFLKAILNRDKFVDTGYLKAWTFTIMRNTFINNYRRNAMQKTYCEHTGETISLNMTKIPSSDNPDSLFSYKEITQSIEQLKDKFRVPFKMYVDGFKYREIADTINLKVGTVKNRIFMARKVLMDKLAR